VGWSVVVTSWRRFKFLRGKCKLCSGRSLVVESLRSHRTNGFSAPRVAKNERDPFLFLFFFFSFERCTHTHRRAGARSLGASIVEPGPIVQELASGPRHACAPATGRYVRGRFNPLPPPSIPPWFPCPHAVLLHTNDEPFLKKGLEQI